VLLTTCYSDEQIKENKTGRASGTYGEGAKCYQIFFFGGGGGRDLKERYRLEDLSFDRSDNIRMCLRED